MGDATRNDKTLGVRVVAAEALGERKSPTAAKQLLEALNGTTEPWLRTSIVSALGNIKDAPEISSKLEAVAKDDKSFRARSAALQSLGKLKAPNALATLKAAIAGDSPDDILRNAALRAMGPLGDDQAVPVLQEWIAVGRPTQTRQAAIYSLARLKKDDQQITQQIAGYLTEPHGRVRFTTIFALGLRGDASAIPALEALLNNGDLSIEVAPMIKQQIAKLKKGPSKKPDTGDANESGESEGGESSMANRLEHLEKMLQEMSDRLKNIEERLPQKK